MSHLNSTTAQTTATKQITPTIAPIIPITKPEGAPPVFALLSSFRDLVCCLSVKNNFLATFFTSDKYSAV